MSGCKGGMYPDQPIEFADLSGVVLDEDDMVSNSDQHMVTQQSLVAYLAGIGGGLSDPIAYDASSNTPDLDTSPSGILAGDFYYVTAAGTFFTEGVDIGDQLIAIQDDPTTLAHWIRSEKNLNQATNTVLGNIKTTITSEVDTGTDPNKAITPDALTGSSPTLNGDNITNVATAITVVQAARKGSAGTIAKGNPVFVSDFHVGSSSVEVEEADNDSSATMPAFGLAAAAITNSVNQDVILAGKLFDVNTAAWSAGDELWVSGDPSTTLGLTNAKPTGAVEIQKIAVVLRVHASNGVLAVFPGRTNDLPKLGDAKIWLGNASSVPTEVSMSGDIAIDNTGIAKALLNLGVGSPTIDTIRKYIDSTGSSGYFEGFLLSDGGAGTLDVSGGEGFIRVTASSTAPLLSFKNSVGITGMAIPNNTTQYVFVDDGGAISLSTDEFLEAEDKILIGVVTDEGGTIESVFNLGVRLDESVGQAGRFIRRVHTVTRDVRRGGLKFSETGTRNLIMSSGHLWWGRTDYTINAINTSISDSFDTYSASGQEASAATQWDNLQYDNAGTLTTLGANKWANHWLFIEPNDQVILIYGRVEHNSEASAIQEPVPTTALPNRLTAASVIAARLTFKKSAATGSIASSFDTTFRAVGSTLSEFPDDVFKILDNSDPTKIMEFIVDNIATATTRTITMPDRDIDLSWLGELITNSTGSGITTGKALTYDTGDTGFKEASQGDLFLGVHSGATAAAAADLKIVTVGKIGCDINGTVAVGDKLRVSSVSGHLEKRLPGDLGDVVAVAVEAGTDAILEVILLSAPIRPLRTVEIFKFPGPISGTTLDLISTNFTTTSYIFTGDMKRVIGVKAKMGTPDTGASQPVYCLERDLSDIFTNTFTNSTADAFGTRESTPAAGIDKDLLEDGDTLTIAVNVAGTNGDGTDLDVYVELEQEIKL